MHSTTLKTCSKRVDVALAKDGHARMHNALGWRLTAAGGTLWVTQDGDRRDVVLKPGESFAFDRPIVLVSALGAATAQFAQLEAALMSSGQVDAGKRCRVTDCREAPAL